jgi:hypothetical protein
LWTVNSTALCRSRGRRERRRGRYKENGRRKEKGRKRTLSELVLELNLGLEDVGGGPGLGEGNAVLGVDVLALKVTSDGAGLGVTVTGDAELDAVGGTGLGEEEEGVGMGGVGGDGKLRERKGEEGRGGSVVERKRTRFLLRRDGKDVSEILWDASANPPPAPPAEAWATNRSRSLDLRGVVRLPSAEAFFVEEEWHRTPSTRRVAAARFLPRLEQAEWRAGGLDEVREGREVQANLDLKGVAGEGEVLVEEVRGGLAAARIVSRSARVVSRRGGE